MPSEHHIFRGPHGTSIAVIREKNNVMLSEFLELYDTQRPKLIYMDPPFFTQEDHLMKDGTFAFTDRWNCSFDGYLNTILHAAANIQFALHNEGSFVLHCDPRTSHHFKVKLDTSWFEMNCFKSEIIWRYRRWPSKTANFQRIHDVLLRYIKNPLAKATFNQLYEPLAPSTRKSFGSTKQHAVLVDGERVKSERTKDESPGVPLGDVWDIPLLAPSSKERTGYPTQKPEALLERLILSLTNPGDTVMDLTCGSGTTLAVAARLGRHAIGCDIGEMAIATTCKRLLKMGCR